MQELLELRELTSHAQKKGDIEDDLVQNMINTESTLNDRMGQSELRLFSGSKPSSAELNQGGKQDILEDLKKPLSSQGKKLIAVVATISLGKPYSIIAFLLGFEKNLWNLVRICCG